MQKHLILVEKLSLMLGTKKVLDNICFSIDRGEIVAIIGANGSGKTSLLKALCGLIKPSTGSIQIAQMQYSNAQDLQNLRSQIGYAPDTPPLYPLDTVASYLQFICKLRQMTKNDAERQIQYYLELLNLTIYRSHLIHTLSKGTQQRVNLAQAMLHTPKILILDEPTNALDQQETANFCQHIKKLQDNGVTVIIASHQYNEIIPLCNYMLKVENNGITKILTPLTKQGITINHEQHSEQWHYST